MCTWVDVFFSRLLIVARRHLSNSVAKYEANILAPELFDNKRTKRKGIQWYKFYGKLPFLSPYFFSLTQSTFYWLRHSIRVSSCFTNSKKKNNIGFHWTLNTPMLSVFILENTPNITWNKMIATHYSLFSCHSVQQKRHKIIRRCWRDRVRFEVC